MRKVHIRPIPEKPTRESYRLRPLIFCIRIFCLSAVLLAFTVNSALADELIMKNGDRLQGKVMSMSLGKLVFKTPYAGEITIDWDQVARLTTEGPLEVYLRDEKILKGRAVAAKEGKLVLQSESGPRTPPVAMAQVKTLDLPKPPEKWKFHVRVAAGASKESGNTRTEKYNLDGQTTLFKFPHDIKLYGEYHREMSKGAVTKDNALGSLTYKRFISKKWYLFGNGTAQMDKFKDLNLLAHVAAGPGYQVWRSHKKNLSIAVGPGYAIERYTKPMKNFDNKDHREYFAGFWTMDFDMWFFNRFFQVFHHNDGLVDTKDTNNWQFRTRTGVRIPLVFRFFASLEYDYDYVNSPADDKKKYDQSYLFKLGWGL